MELYKKEREMGTTVSLDGHAADELFAGYGFDVLKAYPDAKTKEEIDMITTAYLNQDAEDGVSQQSAAFKKQRNRLYREYMLKYHAKKLLGKETVKSAYSDHPEMTVWIILIRHYLSPHMRRSCRHCCATMTGTAWQRALRSVCRFWITGS